VQTTRLSGLAGVLAAVVLALPVRADSDVPTFSAARARTHYLMFCQGCHEADASGRDSVPPMRGQLGHFLKVPGGREFIVRVPGVISNPMSDAEVAEIMNWALATFSADELPSDFEPYTAAEIGALRREPLTDVSSARARLVERIEAQNPSVSMR